MSTVPEVSLKFDLNNGFTLPTVGLGTFQGSDGNSRVKEIVLSALRKGYRHIDCATAYGNEDEVGKAIRESGIPREELFVTTKLSQTWHEPSDVAEAIELSLRALQLEYGANANLDPSGFYLQQS
ncbi:MAG: hypothetical protein M1816_000573 [Peltula sp. TS41687]|nr:MAG: hypothetical protein M1816_000573 [Peltula sp. TS41687]